MKLFTIGCSFTEGQTLKNQTQECYAHLTAANLEIDYFNFGACGASNDYIFRKVFELLNSKTITKDDIIIIQWTSYIRKELLFEHGDKEFYHYIPTSFHAYDDKVIKTDFLKPSVQNNYINQDLDKTRKNIESQNKEFLNKYNLKFLNKNYQLNATINYINALYTYLEHFDYKHLHFFGWDACVIESVFDNKTNFIKESFGGYTKTNFNEHPNKAGHKQWSTFLTKKINEFSFIDEHENQINNYTKNLNKLKIEIEEEIPNLFKNRMNKLKIAIEKELDEAADKIKDKKEIELVTQIEKIKKQKQLQLEQELTAKKVELQKIDEQKKQKQLEIQNELNAKKVELEKLERQLKEKIETFNKKPKTLI